MSGRSRYLADCTGRGVRVAVVDSGIHAEHPHVRGVECGVAIRVDGWQDGDYTDRLGHGTAVAAAIREKAPAAAMLAVKVFWQALATDAPSLVRGLDAAIALDAHLVNLSLGTSNMEHERLLMEAVERLADRGIAIVAALQHEDVRWLPGSLPGVVPVVLDWACPRDAYRVVRLDGRSAIAASGYPRDIPNVPRHRNVSGISFAVANASGFVARACEACPHPMLQDIFAVLESGIPTAGRHHG